MPAPTTSSEVPTGVRTRLRRAKSELLRVRGQIDRWLDLRRAEDARQPFRRFKSQLDALVQSLHGALDQIVLPIDAPSLAGRPMGHVFAVCALADLRVAWLQRVWFYFRHKLDQRDDPGLAPVLNAADEIIWSCYKPAFEQTGEPLRTAPLPYVEPLFAPNAILRDDPPRELLWNTDDEFAQACLSALPIPIVAVPVSTLGAPWLLALLAHEVGHHVQADFDRDDGKLARAFGDALASS